MCLPSFIQVTNCLRPPWTWKSCQPSGHTGVEEEGEGEKEEEDGGEASKASREGEASWEEEVSESWAEVAGLAAAFFRRPLGLGPGSVLGLGSGASVWALGVAAMTGFPDLWALWDAAAGVDLCSHPHTTCFFAAITGTGWST